MLPEKRLPCDTTSGYSHVRKTPCSVLFELQQQEKKNNDNCLNLEDNQSCLCFGDQIEGVGKHCKTVGLWGGNATR